MISLYLIFYYGFSYVLGVGGLDDRQGCMLIGLCGVEVLVEWIMYLVIGVRR